MVTFSKTIDSLKSQCEHLTSLVREDDQQATQSEEVKAMRKELEYAMERASKAERRKRELASELLAQRTKNELVIHELEGKVNQYEVLELGRTLPDLTDASCRRIYGNSYSLIASSGKRIKSPKSSYGKRRID